MDITTAIVLVLLVFAAFAVVLVALLRKGDVKAGGTFGHGSFFIDVKERRPKLSIND